MFRDRWVHDLYATDQTTMLIAWIFWVIFSICLHELAHGWAALWQGDHTPRRLGHMTMNPLVHMGGWSLIAFAIIGIAWGAMPVSEFTTAELQRTARAVMRAYLDREAGRETAAGLARFLTAGAEATLENRPPRQEPAGSIGHAGVGPVSLLRLGPDRAYACAAVPGARG
jgi:hypothetical protein